MSNLPRQDELEFHIRHEPGGRVSGHVANTLTAGDRIKLEGPFGEAHLRPQGHPTTLLVAGSSGLVPVLSILRSLLDSSRAPGPIHVYQGVRDARDLYEQAWLTALAQAVTITYTRCCPCPLSPRHCKPDSCTKPWARISLHSRRLKFTSMAPRPWWNRSRSWPRNAARQPNTFTLTPPMPHHQSL